MFELKTEEIAKNKIILLYIIYSFQIPVSDSLLTIFILEKEYMNYFIYKQHLSELVESKLIEMNQSEKTNYYLITSAGKRALEFFQSALTEEIKDTIGCHIVERKKILLREQEIVANFVKISDVEYIVYLMVIEKGSPIIDLRLSAPSLKQAEKICNKWKRNPSELYKKIIELLI